VKSEKLKLDAVDLLEHFKIKNVKKISRGEIAFSCPRTSGHTFGDTHPSAHFNEDKGVFRCKGCNWSGDTLGFVMAMRPDWNVITAWQFLRERYGSLYEPPRGGSLASEARDVEERLARRRTLLLTPPSVDNTYVVDWRRADPSHPSVAYMLGRGFPVDELNSWGIGIDRHNGRVTIPIRDSFGTALGFKARAIDDTQPKYLLYGPERGLPLLDVSSYLFGLYLARQARTGRLVLSEGEFNTMALHRDGVPDAVALGTASMSEAQLRLIRTYASEVVLFLDYDLAGNTATWGDPEHDDRPGLIERLIPYVSVRVVGPHEGDPASMPPSQPAALVAQAKPWTSVLAL
jgi:DNA primase